MASPQLENGYTKIANEILDAFIGSKVTIPAEVRRIVDFIIRKTYGFRKKEDSISLSQFALATRLKKPSTIRAIHKAISMGIISRTANGITWKYRFIKDFTLWRPLAPRLIISPTANKSLAPRLPTKETIQKKEGANAPVPPMKTHNENHHSDFWEEIIDIDTGKPVQKILKNVKPGTANTMWSLISWAVKEKRDNRAFPNLGKQFKALKILQEIGVPPNEIITRWEEMELDKFYEKTGIDFMSVVQSFEKKAK